MKAYRIPGIGIGFETPNGGRITLPASSEGGIILVSPRSIHGYEGMTEFDIQGIIDMLYNEVK